jgi:DNA-binding transcriptional MerR regulator/methylmalonyl-CoA mutase cobalamin-binding subunit
MATERARRAGDHPIGVAAERTGLSPEVLRVWERRYRAVEPIRTDGGQRLYSDADLERLRLLSQATAAGRSISRIAGLPVAELAKLVRDDEDARRRLGVHEAARRTPAATDVPSEVAEAGARARALDGPGLERVLRRSAALRGVTSFLDRVATPLSVLVGEEREAGQDHAHGAPGAERLMAVTLRRVIEGIMPALVVASDAPNLLAATPAGDRHEIEAVMAAAVAAAEGWRVTYLGPGVPATDIAAAAASTSARAVSVTVPRVDGGDQLLREVRALRSRLAARVPLLVSGAGAHALVSEALGPSVQIIDNLGDLRVALRIAGQPSSA